MVIFTAVVASYGRHFSVQCNESLHKLHPIHAEDSPANIFKSDALVLYNFCDDGRGMLLETSSNYIQRRRQPTGIQLRLGRVLCPIPEHSLSLKRL